MRFGRPCGVPGQPACYDSGRSATPWSASTCQATRRRTDASRSAHLLQVGLRGLRQPAAWGASSAPSVAPTSSSSATMTTTSDGQHGGRVGLPDERPRRLRRTERLRAMVRETRVSPEQLIYPLSSPPARGCGARSRRSPAASTSRPTRPRARRARSKSLGIGGVILFGLPRAKDAVGHRGVRRRRRRAAGGTAAIRAECRELLVMTDVCLCEYTSHGHCGVVEDGEVAERPHPRAARADGGVPRASRAPTWWRPPT